MINYYKYHAFFCTNQRNDNKKCCGNNSFVDAKEMYRYAKDKSREKNLLGKNKIGISESRCLGRCANGPVIVVYPEEVWYRWETKQDIDEIIKSHFENNQIVTRLMIL